MKTPEDIKKALECCSDADGFDGDCIKCPYKGEQWCGDKSKIDALAYIQQLENQIGELTEKVAQLEAVQPKWISVEDRLPEHTVTPCLIYADGDMEMACWTHDKYELAWWFFVDGEYETGVTHWMPLPEPPKVRA